MRNRAILALLLALLMTLTGCAAKEDALRFTYQLLDVWSFDLGDGVRVVDCRRLMESPEYLTTSSCTLVVRATFTEGQSGAR